MQARALGNDTGGRMRPLYQLARRIVPPLEISNEGIKYYASLVSYYSVFRLQQFDPWDVSNLAGCSTLT